MKKGDEKLQKIYEYISSFTDNCGYPPTIREIAHEFSIKSTSTVQYYLDKLRTSGKIDTANNKSRSYVVRDSKQKPNYVPLLGNVSAGTGMLLLNENDGAYPLPQFLFNGDDLFLLRVNGDSMILSGISNGDYVVVHSQNTAEIGDIVVAVWNDNVTVKRLLSTQNALVLHPENETMTDIVLAPSEKPQIIGKVVGCLKKF